MKLTPLLPLAVLLLSLNSQAEYESELRDAGSLGAIRLAGTEDPDVRKVYIVQLQSPSAAGHYAALASTPAK